MVSQGKNAAGGRGKGYSKGFQGRWGKGYGDSDGAPMKSSGKDGKDGRLGKNGPRGVPRTPEFELDALIPHTQDNGAPLQGVKTVQQLEAEMLTAKLSSSGTLLNPKEALAKQPLEAKGSHCEVRKHSEMGCAVVTMESEHAREVVLKLVAEKMGVLDKGTGEKRPVVKVGDATLQLRPHMDKSTRTEVKTDIFVGWGRLTEKQSPLSPIDIANTFDNLFREGARFGQAPPVGQAPMMHSMPHMQQQQPLSTGPFQQRVVMPVPGQAPPSFGLGGVPPQVAQAPNMVMAPQMAPHQLPPHLMQQQMQQQQMQQQQMQQQQLYQQRLQQQQQQQAAMAQQQAAQQAAAQQAAAAAQHAAQQQFYMQQQQQHQQQQQQQQNQQWMAYYNQQGYAQTAPQQAQMPQGNQWGYSDQWGQGGVPYAQGYGMTGDASYGYGYGAS